jgi:hypothetical protein
MPRGPQAAAARSAGPESGIYKNGVPGWPPHGTFPLAPLSRLGGTDTPPTGPEIQIPYSHNPESGHDTCGQKPSTPHKVIIRPAYHARALGPHSPLDEA